MRPGGRPSYPNPGGDGTVGSCANPRDSGETGQGSRVRNRSLLLRVAARALAELLAGGGRVEDVVHDLESEPELGRVLAYGGLLPIRGTGQDRADADALLDEGPRLVLVDQV